jgi:Ni2+-binding GTPase involved in maturation of urease and hydrogenase
LSLVVRRILHSQLYGRAKSSNMLVVGLSGGIAAGKSTVTRQLLSLGTPVIDCDRIAHDTARKVRCAAVLLFGQQVAAVAAHCATHLVVLLATVLPLRR